jgi:hypothetical protein
MENFDNARSQKDANWLFYNWPFRIVEALKKPIKGKIL